MIMAYCCTAGLPDFAEIVQIAFFGESVKQKSPGMMNTIGDFTLNTQIT